VSRFAFARMMTREAALLAMLVLLDSGCRAVDPAKRSLTTNAATPQPTFHQVYPYSVVPGGIHSALELVTAEFSSPQLLEHYMDIRLAVVQERNMPQDRMYYASWRKDGAIYWTAKPLLIRKGEPVLTDGVGVIRMRCGNRLSETPQKPVAPFTEPPELYREDEPVIKLDEPPNVPPARLIEVLTTPQLPGWTELPEDLPVPPVQRVRVPVGRSPGIWIEPAVWIARRPVVVPIAPLAAVPEPSTGQFMIGLGLMIVALNFSDKLRKVFV
jgi:hypothetical protein